LVFEEVKVRCWNKFSMTGVSGSTITVWLLGERYRARCLERLYNFFKTPYGKIKDLNFDKIKKTMKAIWAFEEVPDK
jgi:hypothetical protein